MSGPLRYPPIDANAFASAPEIPMRSAHEFSNQNAHSGSLPPPVQLPPPMAFYPPPPAPPGGPMYNNLAPPMQQNPWANPYVSSYPVYTSSQPQMQQPFAFPRGAIDRRGKCRKMVRIVAMMFLAMFLMSAFSKMGHHRNKHHGDDNDDDEWDDEEDDGGRYVPLDSFVGKVLLEGDEAECPDGYECVTVDDLPKHPPKHSRRQWDAEPTMVMDGPAESFGAHPTALSGRTGDHPQHNDERRPPPPQPQHQSQQQPEAAPATAPPPPPHHDDDDDGSAPAPPPPGSPNSSLPPPPPPPMDMPSQQGQQEGEGEAPPPPPANDEPADRQMPPPPPPAQQPREDGQARPQPVAATATERFVVMLRGALRSWPPTHRHDDEDHDDEDDDEREERDHDDSDDDGEDSERHRSSSSSRDRDRRRKMRRGGPIRIVRPGQGLTMDYVADRLTIQVDDQNVIIQLSWG